MANSGPLKRTLSDQLADDLGQEIVRGSLRPGDALPSEESLLARFGVSRTVLREALQVLAAKGLLEARPRRGTSIRPYSAWSRLDPVLLEWHARLPADHPMLPQLMEVRRIVEPSAAALAARRAGSDDRERIASAYAGMEAAGEDVEAFIRSDLEFHTAILEASGNQFLLPLAHAIRATLLASLRLTNPYAEENRKVSLPLHAAILEGILKGDEEVAAVAMKNHLEDTERRRNRAMKAGTSDDG
jgi:GntR family transcriptional regulator, galactonate operon transcriptional repressor